MSFKRFALGALLLCLIVSCTSYHTEIFDPKFTKSEDVIESELGALVKCEHVGIHASKTTTNGKETTTLLRVELLNPVTDEDQSATAKKIALQMKQYLESPKWFDQYTVSFTEKKGISSYTRSYSFGRDVE